MWRTYVILVLVGLLLVSVGGNAALSRQVLGAQADIDHLRSRALAAEGAQTSLQKQLDQLKAAGQVGQSSSAGGASSSEVAAPTTPSTPSTSSGPTPSTLGSAPVAPAPTLQPSLQGPAGETALLQQIEAEVAGLRGLAPKRQVPLKFLDQQALQQYFLSNFQKNYLPTERERDQKLLDTLGLLNQGDTVMNLLLGVLSEQVAAVYNEDEKALYLVRDDHAQLGPAERAAFAQNFTHALQDQYFDLGTLSPKHPQNDDKALAIQALVEGDALLVQRLWAQQTLSATARAQVDQGGATTKLDAAPLYMRQQLLFPYTDGFTFVRQVYQTRGGYPGVDAVFLNPPESTQQILHPDKYWAHQQPVQVDLPDLSPALGDGWRMIDSNVLGELDVRLILEQLTDTTRAVRGSSGWAGDRWELLEKDGRQALVLASVWSSDNDARNFFDAFGLALRNRFSGAQQEDSTDTRQALTAATAATDLRRNGALVVAVIAFDRGSADAIFASLGM